MTKNAKKTMDTDMQPILHELREIKIELAHIRKNMADKEMFLTEEEKELLCKSFKREKKMLSADRLKSKLGL